MSANWPDLPLPRASTPPGGPPARQPSPYQTLPLTPDLTALETGMLGDPTTGLLTELARLTRPQDMVSTLHTSLLPNAAPPRPERPTSPDPPREPYDSPAYSAPPGQSMQPGRPMQAMQALQAAITWHQEEAGRLRRRAGELHMVLHRQLQEARAMYVRFDALRRQQALGPRDRRDLDTLATLLPERRAEVERLRAGIRQCVVEAGIHEAAVASLLRRQ